MATKVNITRLKTWHEDLRDPMLTGLLSLQIFAIFVATPLAAMNYPIPRDAIDILLLLFVLLVVLVSRGKIETGLAVIAVTFSLSGWIMRLEDPSRTTQWLGHTGIIIGFLVLSYVIGKAVFAPGKITGHRIRGAVVLYLNIAIIFTAAFRLIWELYPQAFTNLTHASNETHQLSTMLYFSFTTLTSTGYGDIVPADPIARSLANLEAVLGQLYPATLLARIVTLAND